MCVYSARESERECVCEGEKGGREAVAAMHLQSIDTTHAYAKKQIPLTLSY